MFDVCNRGQSQSAAQPSCRKVTEGARRTFARLALRKGRGAGGVERDLALDLCITWWMWPFNTVADEPQGANACSASWVPSPLS